MVILMLLLLSAVLYLVLDKKATHENLHGKHVVITGGSSGIGKASALEASRLGAHVTIIGRDEQKLKAAVSEVRSKCLNSDDQKIQYAALDVTAGYDVIAKCLSSLEAEIGPIFMLVNSAGSCTCGQFENMKVEDIQQMVNLNYFGTAFPTKYVLPGMKKRGEGIIVFVSSEAALLGIYGYSAYSGGKWAVRGLAESLLMELVGTGVSLTLAFPPDTDTPGFEKEELTKPEETKLISGSGGLQSPDNVGKQLVRDALNGKTYSVFGISGQLMSLLYCGSIDSVTQVLVQICSMGVLRAVMVGVLISFQKIVKDGIKKKTLTEPSKTK